MIKVFFVSFECVPFAKVGGLGDVIGSLPRFLKSKKCDVRIIIPLHKSVDIKKFKLKKLDGKVIVPLKDSYIEGYIWQGKLGRNVTVYFIENDRFFNRDEIYATSVGDYPDNPLRFIFFCRAGLETMKLLGIKPDIIHCHDMQTGLIPAYLKTVYRIDAFFYHTKTVFTIHNIAYQGVYDKEIHYIAGFAPWDFVPEKTEYYDKINFMKCGIIFSDMVTTVSPSYAEMISTIPSEGRGLEGVLKKRYEEKKFIGILNGIDYNEWNPEKDEFIKANYNVTKIEKKVLCKEELQHLCKLEVRNDIPLYGMVSRIDPLKGFDLLIKTLPKILEKENIQVVILGKGYKNLQKELEEIHKKYNKKFRLVIDFNNPLSHKIYAGADFFLMPSISEPCGLSQMIAMRYGTIPIVYHTGGLKDSVHQYEPEKGTGTGFVFTMYSEEEFIKKILESKKVFFNVPQMKQLITNAMSTIYSWESSAEKYLKIYSELKNK